MQGVTIPNRIVLTVKHGFGIHLYSFPASLQNRSGAVRSNDVAAADDAGREVRGGAENRPRPYGRFRRVALAGPGRGRVRLRRPRKEKDVQSIGVSYDSKAEYAGLRTVPVEKAPGHWVLASLGKRVLRPGGLELTKHLLAKLAIGETDDVLEFAPGMGVTAKLAIERHPNSYTAVERDETAARRLVKVFGGGIRCVQGSAECTGLAPESFSAVYGEAMLSMQTAEAKTRIINEAYRVLRHGGRYGIHELCIVPDDAREDIRREIQRRLSLKIHVGVQPLVVPEWQQFFERAGFRIVWEGRAPMRLLEPGRLIRDEGLGGALRFAANLVRRPDALRRVASMRRVFRDYRSHLEAVAFVCAKG